MSLEEFKAIVSDHPDLTSELHRLREYLSYLEVGQFFTINKVQRFARLEESTAESLIKILEDHEFVKQDSRWWCVNCEQPVEQSDEQIPVCDLCNQPADSTYEGYNVSKLIPRNRPWYANYKDLSHYDEFHRLFLEGIPRFVYMLQVVPPAFIRAAIDTGRHVQEHDFRDEMQRAISFMCGADGEVSRTTGRCDLIIRKNPHDLRSIVGEFKVWPRNDYKEVVDQLLSYFTDFEELGFIFMVNENKKAIGERYKKEVISANKSFIPKSLNDSPVLRSNNQLEHFLSRHKLSGERIISVFHYIFNIHYGRVV